MSALIVSDAEPWQNIQTPFHGYAQSYYMRDTRGVAHYLHRHGNKGWYLSHCGGPHMHVAPRGAAFHAALEAFWKHPSTVEWLAEAFGRKRPDPAETA